MSHIAVPELRRYAPDALRMVGIPLGQSDETADMFVWTEAVVGGAVRVDHRDDEDLDVLQQLPGGRVGRVVGEQPLGELERDERGRPFPRVLLRVGEHSDA